MHAKHVCRQSEHKVETFRKCAQNVVAAAGRSVQFHLLHGLQTVHRSDAPRMVPHLPMLLIDSTVRANTFIYNIFPLLSLSRHPSPAPAFILQ